MKLTDVLSTLEAAGHQELTASNPQYRIFSRAINQWDRHQLHFDLDSEGNVSVLMWQLVCLDRSYNQSEEIHNPTLEGAMKFIEFYQ